MRVTIADVARQAGVSKTTVSRVVNLKGEVDGSTAARVREVIAHSATCPARAPSGWPAAAVVRSGMLVPSLTWPWMGEVLQGVVDTVEAADYGLLLFTCNRGAESVERFTSQVSARAFDGLRRRRTGEHPRPPDRTAPVRPADRPHRRPRPPPRIPLRRDHQPRRRRVGGPPSAGSGRTRPLVLTGPAALRLRTRPARGIPVGPADRPRRPQGDFTERSGRLAVERLLAAGTEFDSVFAHNDISAAGVLRALRGAGRRVPDDIAVVGFDDIPMAEHTEPPLTTVHQPTRQMGETARPDAPLPPQRHRRTGRAGRVAHRTGRAPLGAVTEGPWARRPARTRTHPYRPSRTRPARTRRAECCPRPGSP